MTLSTGKPQDLDAQSLEQALLSLTPQEFTKLFGGVTRDDHGLPVTGDPVVDQWEREQREAILNGESDHHVGT